MPRGICYCLDFDVENDFSGINYISIRAGTQYFPNNIKYQICCKMCCKNVENRLTNKKFICQNILIGIFL